MPDLFYSSTDSCSCTLNEGAFIHSRFADGARSVVVSVVDDDDDDVDDDDVIARKVPN